MTLNDRLTIAVSESDPDQVDAIQEECCIECSRRNLPFDCKTCRWLKQCNQAMVKVINGDDNYDKRHI